MAFGSVNSYECSDTTFSLNDKYPGLTDGVSYMLSTDGSVKNISRFQDDAVLHTIFPKTHFDTTIENGKDLFTVIDVPFVRRISPMKSRSNATHIGYICGTPGAI